MTRSEPPAAPSRDADTAADLREQIREAYEQDRSQMTLLLARRFGVPETEVLRALPTGMVHELDPAYWQGIIEALEPLGDVHVISSNASVTLECFGTFGNFSTWGDFFNVQTKSLDMHIRYKQLAAIFAVQKPGHMDGVQTLSFQFFDPQGHSAFKVFLSFGQKPASAERTAAFDAIRQRFALPQA